MNLKRNTRAFYQSCQRWCLSQTGQIVMLMILLVRITWGIWTWRDMTYGDTAGYYHHILEDPSVESRMLVFSPLYSLFYSGFVHAFESAFVATILHRLVILVLLSLSLLQLARRLLPKAMAWLVAAWWLVLPINWNALYEVHLFGFLPLALGCWLIGGRHRGSLAWGLALVWTGALLVRNEYALSVALLAVCGVVREWFRWRKTAGSGAGQLISRMGRLALPSLLVVVMTVVVWHRDWHGWPRLQEAFHWRHTLNMAQVYPFSYQQRHPEWSKDPWRQGGDLMKEQFGDHFVTFSDAFKRNPGAIWEHVFWHFHLLPAGLQDGLFSCISGTDSPDFIPAPQRPVRAITLSALLIALLVAGAVCLWLQRSKWKRFVRSRRAWNWLALVFLLPPCVVAIVTQRPRPSYLFPLSFFIMALAGLCLYGVLRRVKLWRLFQAALPLFMIAIIVSAAPEKKTAQLYEGQVLLTIYERVFAYKDSLAGKKALASRQFSPEVEVLLNVKSLNPTFLTLSDAIEQTASDFDKALKEHKVGSVYLAPADLLQPGVKDWLTRAAAKNWVVKVNATQAQDPWAFLVRAPTPAKAKAEEEKDEAR